ncbi:MAG: BolA/IbaG family iron-sulfur metabolism protein [Gammaproteobacteria bacterium]|nr:BolA/IbaG family iron-sulfur metabolism protein [Gammaproteobacteria bacterium]
MRIQATIETKLQAGLFPEVCNVINESHMHNVPAGSESHFKVTLVSDAFNGKMLVARHKMIYKLLDDELKNDIHALALHTYTKNEWDARQSSPDSPPCLGGGVK